MHLQRQRYPIVVLRIYKYSAKIALRINDLTELSFQ